MRKSISSSGPYENHLWYPIVVRVNGESRIVEMSGAEMNLWRAYIGSVEDVVFVVR
jgi:hypothetical protein